MNGDSTTVAASKPRRRNVLTRYFSRFDDGELIRWAFRGLLVGAVGVLALDLNELMRENGGLWPSRAAPTPALSEPVLPPVVETSSQPQRQTVDPRDFVTADEATLRKPITFNLQSEGILLAQGNITPGSAARLEEELAARGEYVKTVSLNSPGGSLDDAMAMARLIRERGLATRVENGSICASSCPLLLAGGIERNADAKAAVGVHQFYAAGKSSSSPAQIMADAQMTAARISRHLDEMGVDTALWLHALDTPPTMLYYLTPEEMAEYGLVTGAETVARK